MMDSIRSRFSDAQKVRRLLFWAALVMSLLIVLIELGAVGVLKGAAQKASGVGDIIPNDPQVQEAFNGLDSDQTQQLSSLASQNRPQGLGIPYMALLDGIILFTVGLIGLSEIISHRTHARIQGVATFIFAIVIIIVAIIMAFIAFALVLLMIGLLLAIPFGTLVYLAKFGFFNTGGAEAALALIWTLKVLFAICLVAANQRYLQNKGLVLLFLTSLVANMILAFVHGFVPGFLVSITDGIGAIIVAVLAIIWAIVLLVGSVPAVVRAVNISRA